MKFTAMQALLAALSALLVFASHASADEHQLTDVERRFAQIAQRTSGRYLVQPAVFMPPGELGTEHLPAPRELADTATSEAVGNQCPCGETTSDNWEEKTDHDYFAEVQIMWLRAHVMENAVGKLSERYEFSPRLIIGYESAGGIGGRIRYWHYDQSTENLTDPTQPMRFEFDIVDLEGTGRFGTERVELVVAGGFRWGDARITLADAPMNIDMPGITFAADLRTIICRNRCWEWANIAGARWSIMGGDWDGAPNGFLASNRDDNLTVTEIYGGFEYLQHYRRIDAFARIAFEVQTWHSDVASQTAGGDSINFMGPGVHVGLIR